MRGSGPAAEELHRPPPPIRRRQDRRSLRRQAGVEPKRRTRDRVPGMTINPYGRCVDYRRLRRLAAAHDLGHDRRLRGDLHPDGRLFRARVELGRRLSFGSQFRAMHPAVLARPIGTRSPPGRRGMGTVHLPPRSEPSLPPRPQLPERGRARRGWFSYCSRSSLSPCVSGNGRGGLVQRCASGPLGASDDLSLVSRVDETGTRSAVSRAPAARGTNSARSSRRS